jgi:hypothetical protein
MLILHRQTLFRHLQVAQFASAAQDPPFGVEPQRFPPGEALGAAEGTPLLSITVHVFARPWPVQAVPKQHSLLFLQGLFTHVGPGPGAELGEADGMLTGDGQTNGDVFSRSSNV